MSSLPPPRRSVFAVWRWPRWVWAATVVLLVVAYFTWPAGKLTGQEQAFVGRWKVTVTSQLGLFSPYVDVWEIKPDRTLQILRDDPKSPGNLVLLFDCNWTVRNNKFDLETNAPRTLRQHVQQMQEVVRSARRFERLPSRHALHDIKSSTATQNVLWTQQTYKPVSYQVHDMVRLTQ